MGFQALRATLFVMAVVLSGFANRPSNADANLCGNFIDKCILPLFGLSTANSKERKTLELLYEKLYNSADNDVEKLSADRLATAVHQILGKADDSKIHFWVLVMNPTDQKKTETFYLSRATNSFKGSIGLSVLDVNCPLTRDDCAADETAAFNATWSQLQKEGELVGEFDVTIEARSIAVQGFHVPLPADPSGDIAIALLGPGAKKHLKPDRRDLLHVGFIHEDGRASELGEASRKTDTCGFFASYVEAEYDEPDDNIFASERHLKCHRWNVVSSKSCEGSESYRYYRRTKSSTDSLSGNVSQDPGETESKCGSKKSRFFVD